jgi:hypothetical protein
VTTTDATRLAVLIDSDNTTASLTTELLEEIAKYGTPTVKRAYGDWTTLHAAGDKAAGIGDDRVRARAPQHTRPLRRSL